MTFIKTFFSSKKRWTFIVALSALMATGLMFGDYVVAQSTDVQATQKVGKALLIDVRSAEEFKVDGVKSAINIPYQNISKKIKPFTNGQKDIEIKLYCRSGRRAHIALKTLQQLGYTNVVNLGAVADAEKYIQTHP